MVSPDIPHVADGEQKSETRADALDIKHQSSEVVAGADPEEDMEPESFWDALDSTIGDKADAERKVVADKHAVVKSKGPVTSLVPSERGLFEVAAECVEELARKLDRIVQMTGASLTLKQGQLKIQGTPPSRARGERYARAVVDQKAVLEDHPDISIVPVSTEFQDQLRGKEGAIENETDVMIFFASVTSEKTTRFATNQVVEAQRGNSATWHMATVLGQAAPRTLRARWSVDGSIEEVDVVRVRPAPAIGIFGTPRARLGAEISIMSLFETKAKGSIAARLSTMPMSNGLGISSVELMVKPSSMWRLEKHPFVGHLPRATGCIAIEFFQRPMWSAGESGTSSHCALIAGNREQRWQASEVLVLFVAEMDKPKSEGLPKQLAGECYLVKVPKAMMGVLVGAKLSNLVNLMEMTATFVFPLGERAGRVSEKSEMDDLLESMFAQEPKATTNDMAIFGRPRARLAARVKIMVAIEGAYPGYFQEQSGVSEIIDPANGLAVDKVWCSEKFETESGKQVELLANASECLVESVGKLVLLAGTQEERTRAREYVRWMTARRFGNMLVIPELESRRDAVQLKVPRDVIPVPWLDKEWEKLGLETKTIVFYDGWQGDGGQERLVVLGSVLRQRGKMVGEMLTEAKNLVDKVLACTREGRSLETLEDKEAEKDDANDDGKGGKGNEKGKGKFKGKEKGKDGKGKDGKGKDGKGDFGPKVVFYAEGAEIPDDGKGNKGKGKKGKGKDTPEIGVGVKPPQTPGVFGVKPPQTHGTFGVAPPRTPGTFGVSAPQTPALPAKHPLTSTEDSTELDSEPPKKKATVAAPQTPAGARPPASARVAAPQTPAGVRPPAGARVAAPQTPASYRPMVSAPQTPAGAQAPTGARVGGTLTRFAGAAHASWTATETSSSESMMPPMTPAVNMMPMTPAVASGRPEGGRPVPQTPAAIAVRPLSYRDVAKPVPQTPAVLARSNGPAVGKPVPQTPAVIARR